MLPPGRMWAYADNREERAELAHIAVHPLAPPTEQDKETGEGKHEHDMDGAGQQVMPRRQYRDEPEDDASGQEHAHELGTRDEGGCVVLPPPTTAKQQTEQAHGFGPARPAPIAPA